jgi:hypothetical protein
MAVRCNSLPRGRRLKSLPMRKSAVGRAWRLVATAWVVASTACGAVTATAAEAPPDAGRAAGTLAREEVVRVADPYFSVRVPPGFYRLPPGGSGPYVCAFATSDPAEGTPDAVVGFQRMGGTIGPEPFVPSPSGQLAGKATPTATGTARWRGFDLASIGMRVTLFGRAAETRTVQVPLRREAVQLVVLVPAAKAATADGIAAAFLTGLDGDSSWTAVSPGERTAQTVAGVAGLAAVVGGLAFLGRRAWKRRSQPAPTSPVLATMARAKATARDLAPVKHAAIAFVTSVVAWVCVGCLAIAMGPPVVTDLDRRAEQALFGTVQFSMVVAGVVGGLSFWASRRRRRHAPPPLPPAGGPAAAPAYNFDIVDDRDG